MSESERKPIPPYLPYKTFGTFLDHLRSIGMPSHIDKSVMASLSGGMQSWLKSALRYMKLIDAEDAPTDALAALAAAQGDERKPLLLSLFQSSYGFLKGRVDLKNTTPSKLKAAITEQGAQGETAEKVMAFLVAMAKDAGVPLSSLLTTRTPSVRRPRPKPPKPSDGGPDDEQQEDDDPDGDTGPESKAVKTLELPKSGGTLTLSGNINFFSLTGDERTLVFALIDAMDAFEAKKGGGGD
jgi:hypothetical protein